MSFSALFIERPIATTLLTVGLGLTGALAFRMLPVAALPQVDFPTIQVSAALPGASPETMATSVAAPLERQFGRIAGVTEMTSTSNLGSTAIVLQFDLSRDINGAARDVQAAINAARGYLPPALPNNPTYRKVNPADAPIVILALTSDTVDRGRMYDAASSILQQKLSQVPGVGQVTVGGGALPAVRVDLNPLALAKYGIGLGITLSPKRRIDAMIAACGSPTKMAGPGPGIGVTILSARPRPTVSAGQAQGASRWLPREPAGCGRGPGPRRRRRVLDKEGAMHDRLISGDNHIDLTYCPPDLWSSQAPAKWKLLAPRVEELEDGLHWFVEAQDKGMWNGVGPGFLKYQPGTFRHIDEMKEMGFEWDYRRGAQPRPTTPELRLADLDRDGLEAEVVYGCLMINDLITSGDRRAWANQIYNDWAADFARRADPNRIFPLAIVPNNDPAVAAAEIRRCAKLGLRGGDLHFKTMSLPLYHHGWYPLWEAAAECHFPISFHSTGFKAIRAPDTPQMEQEYLLQHRLVRSALFQLDTMEVFVSIIASGACEKYPDLKFVLGESGVTWLPYVFDRLDTEYEDRGRGLGFSLKPSDYFRRQGYVTYQQDNYLEPIIPLIGEDNILWGADYPHPDCIWPESRRTLEKNLSGFSETVQRKITFDNVAKLYNLR